MAQIQFDARTVNPNEVVEALPAAWYNMAISNSEMKPTKDGAGAYLELTLKVLDGQFANRTTKDRLNLKNNNAMAQEIAYKTLSAICHATGVIQLQDSQQLHNIPMKVKLSLRPANGEYDASNDVKGYKNINEVTGTTTQPPAQGPQMQMPAQQPAQQPQQQWQQPPVQQTQQPPAQQWQQPAQQGSQPWQQPTQQQPVQQPEQQWQQPAQQQPPVQQQQQPPMQQQQAPQQQQTQQPMQTPAQGAMPPWAQQQA